MLFPVIRARNEGSKNEGFIVGTNSHHNLIVDESGGIQFIDSQCMESTRPMGYYEFVSTKGYFGAEIEMVTFEELLHIYKEQIKLSCEKEAKILKFMKDFKEEQLEKNGLDGKKGFNHTAGNLI